MLMCSKGSWTVGAAIVGVSLLLSACTSTGSVRHGTDNASAAPICGRVIQADVVALEQAMVLNRFGAFNPAGMLYALRHDVEFSESVTRANGQVIPAGSLVSDDNLIEAAGHVRLRADKRPRPLVLRANEGDCLQVRFHNLLTPAHHDELSGDPIQYEGRVPAHLQDPPGKVYPIAEADAAGRQLVKMESVSNDRPLTRAASFHVNGLDVLPVPEAACPVSSERHVWLCGTDGGNVGHNRASVRGALPTALREQLRRQGGQVLPGQSAVYRIYAFREGTYFAYSTGATVGGEGAGGQLGAGLFAAVNVQPAGARWYRSQVTHADLAAAARTPSSASYDDLDYDNSRYPADDAQPYRRGLPILSMLDGDEIVHSDLNAIIVLTGGQSRLDAAMDLLASGKGERLLISGVHPSASRRQLQVAMGGDKRLFSCCVDIDRAALDTIGNAEESAKWVESHAYGTIILVTNNYHMPRSLLEMGRLLRNAKLEPYPVVNANLENGGWLTKPEALRVLFTEYNKYLLALARGIVPVKPTPHGFALAETAAGG